MNTDLKKSYNKLITAMEVEGLEIPLTAVKFFKREESLPEEVSKYILEDISLTSCQAMKQSGLGDMICLTQDNIGCIAAAISLGLVDEHQKTPFSGPRTYTDIMKEQSGKGDHFEPPTPDDFTEGIVYACKEANRPDFALFGPNDSGRFKNREIAKNAIGEMIAIQPAVMQAVFFYSQEFETSNLVPDVVSLSVRPVELARIVQAYSYATGQRIESTMGAVRVVNSDLIVRPYLTNKINISTFCVGARLIAQFDADRIGIGMPFKDFQLIADAMEESKTGYPFASYPGAAD